MSINVIGVAAPVPTDVFPNVASLPLSTATHQVEGETNSPTEVFVGPPANVAVTPYFTQAGLGLRITPTTLPNVAITGANHPVLATGEGVDVTNSVATLSLVGNNAESIVATNSGAEADWVARISGPGVVWYHDFRADAEVDAFRANGSDLDPNDTSALPGTCIRQTADGVTGGGCLEVRRPAGTAEPPAWWRPLSPMDTGSGKAVNDPAADGSITVQPWNTANTSEIRDHVNGWYGHPDLQDANFDGHVFYVQMRVKADPRRITGGNEAFTAGKFPWFTTAENGRSLSFGEHVFFSYGSGGNDGTGKNYLNCYVYGATGIGAFDPLWQADSDGFNPGSKWSTTWSYSGGWDTLLFCMKLGTKTTTSGEDASRLRVWAANDGETEYTQVYDQTYGINQYQDDDGGLGRGGLQALLLSSYNNGQNLPQEFWQRYDQIIFSQEWIPCPGSSQVTAPTWFTSLNHLEAVAPLNNATAITNNAHWLGASSVVDPNAYNGLGGGPNGIIIAWTGMGCDQDAKEIFMLGNGGHGDYYGNEVYSCVLSEDNPQWQRRRDATFPATPLSVPVYSDGRPTSTHSSNHHACGEGRWMMLGINVPAGTSAGTTFKQWFEFAPRRGNENRHRSSISNDADDWINLGNNHPELGTGGFGCAIYDPRDRQFITGTAGRAQSLTFTSIDDMTDGNGVLQNSFFWSDDELQFGLDTDNRVILAFEQDFGWWYQRVNTDAEKQGTMTQVVPTGTPPPRTGISFHWHEPSQAFLTWDNGQYLYKGTPTVDGSGNYTALHWETVALHASSPTLPAAPDLSRGMFDRTNFIKDMGDGTSAIIIVPEYADPDTYVIRLTGAV